MSLLHIAVIFNKVIRSSYRGGRGWWTPKSNQIKSNEHLHLTYCCVKTIDNFRQLSECCFQWTQAAVAHSHLLQGLGTLDILRQARDDSDIHKSTPQQKPKVFTQPHPLLGFIGKQGHKCLSQRPSPGLDLTHGKTYSKYDQSNHHWTVLGLMIWDLDIQMEGLKALASIPVEAVTTTCPWKELGIGQPVLCLQRCSDCDRWLDSRVS